MRKGKAILRSPAMICTTCMRFLSKQRASASRFIHMAKCCPRMAGIQKLKAYEHLAFAGNYGGGDGRIRLMNSRNSRAQS